jgi:hypothetical protein
VRPVPLQMWQGRAMFWHRCGRGGPSPGTDLTAVNPVPVQMWQGWAQSRRRCGRAHEGDGLKRCSSPDARVVVSASVRARPMRSTSNGRKNEPSVVSAALTISACDACEIPSEYLRESERSSASQACARARFCVRVCTCVRGACGACMCVCVQGVACEIRRST